MKSLTPSFDPRLFFLLAIYISLILIMNLLGIKLVEFLGFTVSVSLFVAPATFLITDVVEEVYGTRVTKTFLNAAVMCLLMALGLVLLFVHLPPAGRFTANEEYTVVFYQSSRILFASVVAFYLAQLHDVWAFNFWKEKTRGKALWLRNNLSTAGSQAIDTFLFMMIAFYQTTPQYTLGFVLSLCIPYYVIKLTFAVLDTPLVYLGVRWLNSSSSEKILSRSV